jgi:hypothetical protein
MKIWREFRRVSFAERCVWPAPALVRTVDSQTFSAPNGMFLIVQTTTPAYNSQTRQVPTAENLRLHTRGMRGCANDSSREVLVRERD